LAISEATATDFRDHFGEHPEVANVGTGVPHAFTRTEAVDTDPYEAVPELRPGYIMYTGGGDPRKNVPALIDAYGTLPAEVRERHQLVLVYRLVEAERTIIHERCERLGITDDVLVTGFVPDQTLRALYRATHLFVFPSLYEGFGLPIVEASLNGAPVIASNSSSMVELIQDDTLRFDPTRSDEIAGAILDVLARDDLKDVAAAQRMYISETFTWRNSAGAAVEAMLRVGPGSRRQLSHGPARPRIAIVGPLPPQHSGVADYTWRLLPDLARHADIVCVVETENRAGVPIPPDGISVLTIDEFNKMRRVHPFDETVIVMGNSTFHHYCWDLLNDMPATVLAHELRYTGLFQSYGSHRLSDPLFFRHMLAREYGSVDPGLDLNRFLESDTAEDLGIHLVGPVIDRASKFLTTSDYAANVAHLIRPTRASEIMSVGFSYPISATPIHVDAPVPPVLVSVGVQFPTKRTLDLVRALSDVRKAIPDVRLRLGGPIDDWYQADVESLAGELGLEAAVSILGRVPKGQLDQEIEAASIAIQLRSTSNGEVSAAVADCMVAGTPVITTNIGAQTELADAGVELLDRTASPSDIAGAIIAILQDDPRRERMAALGAAWASEHNPTWAAHKLLSALGITS